MGILHHYETNSKLGLMLKYIRPYLLRNLPDNLIRFGGIDITYIRRICSSLLTGTAGV